MFIFIFFLPFMVNKDYHWRSGFELLHSAAVVFSRTLRVMEDCSRDLLLSIIVSLLCK